jgi:hypothetical protein
MRRFSKVLALTGLFGLALTASAAAQHQFPSNTIFYTDYYTEITKGPEPRSLLVHEVPRGQMLIAPGCGGVGVCIATHPLSGSGGYTHLPLLRNPPVKEDLAARAAGRATLTGEERLRVAPGRNANWVSSISGGTRARIESCRDNFCYIFLADGRQGWVHDGALERDRVIVKPPGSDLSRPIAIDSPLRK